MLTTHTLASHRPNERSDAANANAEGFAPEPDSLLTAVAEHQDHLSYARLFDRFAPRIEAYLRRLGAKGALAEDLTQDVMLAVWQRAGQFDPGRATASTWMFSIARNRLIDSFRRRSEVDADVYAIALPADDDTEQGYYLTQLERHLRQAVASLPREQIQLIEQGYFGDKSQSVLADELDLPLGTVKSRQRLALDKLRRILEPVR